MVNHALPNQVPAYTLIELTIVVGLVSLLAISISSVVLMNATTANRTRNLTHTRQVSDFALNQIQQLIRNSKYIDSCDSASNTLTITNQDGGSTTLGLELDGETPRIASGSANYLTPPDISISTFNLNCLPSDSEPTLVELSFSASSLASETARETPSLNFKTSISLRNN